MGNDTGKLLFGIETELGLSAVGPEGEAYDSPAALQKLLEVCADRFVHLRGAVSSPRMYLANGSLIYPDVGHPEFATAESESPLELLQSLRAGEKMLVEATQCVAGRADVDSIALYRTSVDYSAVGTTWGCHESYLSRRQPGEFAAQVVPHLVSRIVYTGAGGFDNRNRGANFVLSPRAPHLVSEINYEVHGRRAIFSLRDEALAGAGHHRVHLVCGECNCSDLSNYLKVGTTALVLAMAEAGVEFGLSETWLPVSVDAMQRFTRDTECRKKALCEGAAALSAIDFQFRYLEAAEARLDEAYMPEWAEEVCRAWRAALERLTSDKKLLVGRLDWPTKLAVFQKYLRARSNLDWESLSTWTTVLSAVWRGLQGDENGWPRLTNHQIATFEKSKGQLAKRISYGTRMLDSHGLDWSQVEEFQAVRDELCELDIRFGQLYPRGIFLDLEAAGEISDRMLEPGQVDEACERAPGNGRARVRGEHIRRLAAEGDKYSCSWTGIRSDTDFLNLEDPFARSAEWQELPPQARAPVAASRNRQRTIDEALRGVGAADDDSRQR